MPAERNPETNTVRLLQLASQHASAGRPAEAEQLCREVLQMDAGQVEALKLLGAIADSRGELERAIDYFQQAGTLLESAETHCNLGLLFRKSGQIAAAAAHYSRAIAIDANLAAAHYSLGKIFHEQGKRKEAISAYRKALALSPTSPHIHLKLGIALREEGNLPEAVGHCQQALSLNPQLPAAHNNLGTALQELGNLEAAISHYSHAIRLKPDYALAHWNLATAFKARGPKTEHLDAAIASYQRALALQSSDVKSASSESQLPLAQAWNGLALVFHERGRLEEAIACYRQALAGSPDFADAHFNLSLALLLAGDLPAGFAQYEWRWLAKTNNPPPPPLEQPLWDGSDLQGKTILLSFEQGFGDAIQFIRYAPLVAQRGGRVIVGAPQPLVRLFQTAAGVARVSDSVDKLDFQVRCPLMSLPYVLETSLETIPAEIPYLFPPNAGNKFVFPESEFKVGIVWAGHPKHSKDRERSCTLADFLPVLTLPGIAFYSLLKGDRAIEIAQLPDSVKLEDLSEQLEDFADTAAAIAELDLVISVDTAVAHLAGALGKPVWVLLAFAPDWRWMLEREDSPWYPTMRLFRQSQPGDWSGVFERVAVALKNYRDAQMSESGKGETPPSNMENLLPATGSSSASTLLKMAARHYQKGQLAEAERTCRQVLDLQPESAEALLLLAVIVYRDKKVDEAIALYRQSLRFMPNNAETHNNLAVALKEQGKVEEAVSHYQQAVALKPDYAEAWHNIGLVFGGGGKFAEASLCCQKAVDLKPDWADARNTLATSLKEEGKLAEAMAHYNRALELDPNHINARCGRADVLLRTGYLLEGFSEYEWRLRHKDCPPRGLSEPLWDGSKAEGKTILLHTEQGLGDAIQFIRYLPLVRERCARVVVECNQKSLRRLLATAAGVGDILVRGEPLPEFHFQAPLMSLPKILGTTLETVPAQIPYLSVPDSATLKLPVAPDAGVRVGAVWGANALNKTAAKRSCPLSLFQKVLDTPGVTFYSLQKELQAAELELLNSRERVYNLKDSLYDLAETAAAISQLDLVISADTAVAHLAGALGKPVWVLLPFHADWRWLENRSDTPWYPTMRLFRQSGADRWEEVLERVAGELQALVSEHREHPVFAKAVTLTPLTPLSHEGRGGKKSRILPSPLVGEGLGVRGITKMGCSPEHRHSQQQTAGGEVPVSPGVGDAKNIAGEPAPILPAGGFNRLKKCRYGVMIYNVNDLYIGRSLDLYGEYSEGEVELFKQILRPGDVAVDAGANIGAHTVFFAQAVGERGAVLAFEPQRIVFQTLCANIALNSITNTYCYSIALSSAPSSIRVPPLNYSQLNNFGGLALGGYLQGEPVEVRTLDSFALEKCRLIKIDVEGMELQVLQGAVKTVEKFKPALYVENDRQEKAAALIRYLDSIGYAMYWHRPTYYNPNNFLGNRDNVFGRTISVNMLCVHRQHNPNVRGLEPVVVPS